MNDVFLNFIPRKLMSLYMYSSYMVKSKARVLNDGQCIMSSLLLYCGLVSLVWEHCYLDRLYVFKLIFIATLTGL